MLNNQELQYYSRQLLLPDFSVEQQLSLKNASVLIIGMGGLGCTVAQLLCRAGVGTLGIVDYDCIDSSNIQRQLLYTYDDIGQQKTDVAERNLKKINPSIEIKKITEKVTAITISSILNGYTIIVDATDNFNTKYLINDACVIYNKTLVFGAITQYNGQVAVFNNHNSINYRDIFPEPSTEQQNCNEVGVLNTGVVIIASIQANEVIKLICQKDIALHNQLITFNVLNYELEKITVPKNYFFSFTDLSHHQKLEKILINSAENIPTNSVVIDVRTAYEFRQTSLVDNAINLPLDFLEEKLCTYTQETPIYFVCNLGNRSKQALQIAKKLGYNNCYEIAH